MSPPTFAMSNLRSGLMRRAARAQRPDAAGGLGWRGSAGRLGPTSRV
jgi:hypothetical protein